MTMHTSIDGYAYVISGFTMYVAVVSLLLHAALACTHIIWTLWTRRTSSAWNRIVEIVLLAQNSRPSNALLTATTDGLNLNRGVFGITGRVQLVSGENAELIWTDNRAQDQATEKIESGELYY